MERKYTIEEIKEVINNAQMKVIDDMENALKEIEADSKLMFAVQLQLMTNIVSLEKAIIEELEGKQNE